MASIKKYDTAKGTAWRVQYRSPDGKSRTKQGFKTKTEAQIWAADNTVNIHTGKWINQNLSKTTINELAALWWKGRQHLKASTLDRDKLIYSRIIEQWGEWQVGSIRTSSIQAWVSGMGKSGSTVRNFHNTLSQILDVAVADGLILANPAHGVKLPKKSAPVKVFLTPKQLSTLAKTAGSTKSHRAVIVWVLGTVGLRWGELAGLQVQDVDFDRARITVRRSVSYVKKSWVASAPKTHERREVSMSFPVARMLYEQCRGKAADAWVFTRDNGQPLRPVNSTTGWFRAAVKKVQEEDPNFPSLTPHGLRHVTAGLLVSAGANVKVVQKQLGHASAAMTLDTYAALFDSDLDSVGETLSAILSDVVELSWDAEKLRAL